MFVSGRTSAGSERLSRVRVTRGRLHAADEKRGWQRSAMLNAYRAIERQICAGTSTYWRRCNHTTLLPWFVDKEFTRHPPPHISASPRVPHPPKPLPPDAPEHLANLHNALCKSPLLESGGVDVLPFNPHQPGPSLPNQFPKGRRRRGRTEFGVGIPDDGDIRLPRCFGGTSTKETVRRGSCMGRVR